MLNDVEEGWGKVADAFRANFEGSPGEVGAACCVYVGGRRVVDRLRVVRVIRRWADQPDHRLLAGSLRSAGRPGAPRATLVGGATKDAFVTLGATKASFERTAIRLGGTLSAGPAPGTGWSVRAVLPLPAREWR